MSSSCVLKCRTDSSLSCRDAILADRPPASRDAKAVSLIEDAGGILVGALNMEELAYGFLTDNAHYGRTRNPHDPERTAGGSSGGSGAAVAAGLVPLALASDTNGSTRIPASFCGVVGFKPTYGRISREGMTLLAPAQDHVGWIGGCVDDVALAWQVLSGRTAPQEARIAGNPVVAVADGYFDQVMTEDTRDAVARTAAALGTSRRVEIAHADVARAAAYAVTSIEASSLRMKDLQAQPARFDPATRDRFLAGALLPAHWYVKAQSFRNWFRTQVRRIFDEVDIIILPASPFPAPRFGEETIVIDGETHPVRPTIGRFTQAVSSLGLPIICVPVARAGGLPIGVQLMARAGEEDLLIATGRALEQRIGEGKGGLTERACSDM